MLIKAISASTIVIAAALIGSQGALAQEATTPDAVSTTNKPGTSTPAQPNTTTIPPSDPAISPQASTTSEGSSTQAAPAEAATQTAQPTQPPPDPASSAPAPAEQAQAAPAEPTAGSPQVAAFVESQFPSLDVDADGALTTTEFEGWISKLKTAELQSAGKPINAEEVKVYAQNALLNADKDSDKKVTKAEATQFFSG